MFLYFYSACPAAILTRHSLNYQITQSLKQLTNQTCMNDVKIGGQACVVLAARFDCMMRSTTELHGRDGSLTHCLRQRVSSLLGAAKAEIMARASEAAERFSDTEIATAGASLGANPAPWRRDCGQASVTNNSGSSVSKGRCCGWPGP